MIQLSRRTVVLVAAALLAVAGLATVSFVRTLTPAEAGTGFTDTPPWIAAHAAWLVSNSIADGYDDNTFRPDNNITRGQAAYWFGNYNDALEVVSAPFTSNVAVRGLTREATCPVGKRAIAGGATHSSLPFNGFFLLQSGRSDDRTWTVSWENPNTGTYGSGTVEVLCAPATLTG